MSELLFLAHRIPYPPDKGDKIRSFHMLRHLAARGPVHLAAFVDDPADMKHVGALREICASVELQPITKADRIRRAIRGYLKGDPVSTAIFYSTSMVRHVREIVRTHDIDRIVVFSGQMAPYAMPYLDGRRRSIMDFVDVDSEKWRQYAEDATGWRHRLYKREAKLLLAAEKYAARQFTVSTFVSEPEAALFRKLAGSYGHTIHAVGNGVDADRFDPATARRKPFGTHPNVVFTGAMDYRPNIDAVRWFAREVWPMVRAIHPDAGFIIVGSDPAPEVKKLGSIAGIRVTGRVPEVLPYLLGADAVVAPLQLARGVQNKVLEAMAAARPVVATPQAFEGIDAVPGRHLLVADTPGLFASALDALFSHGEQAAALGAAARAHILANYSWDAKLAKLDWLLTSDIEELKAKRG